MINKVRETIYKYNMIQAGDNIVIGVSGGVDSMALLHVLNSLRVEMDFHIHIAHVNHGVRGAYAKRDQDFVRQVAEKLGLEFYTIDVNMDEYARELGISSEEAGRLLRYGFFNEIIDGLGQGKIAVGHNLNDQAETLIMRFFRGTGLDGLRGIEHRVGRIIRPILDIGRKELEAFISEESIEITQDHTNFENIYTRNKIRLDLIPYIEENFNPNIVNTLARTADLARLDSDFLDRFSKSKVSGLLNSRREDRLVLDLEKFNLEDLAIRQRILRILIGELKGDIQGITEGHITRSIELLESGETGRTLELGQDIYLETSYNNAILYMGKKESQADVLVDLRDEIEFLKRYLFKIQVLNIEELKGFSNSSYTRYFDYDKIKGTLKIRNRTTGDKFQPFGMKGQKKIKDYFIDEKIPREKRDEIPLVVDDENIIWVVGYRTSELYKITKGTKRVLKIDCKVLK